MARAVHRRRSAVGRFCSSGKPPHQSNTLRRTLHPILENLNEPKCGCHAFRRFRITHLRKNGVPEDLIHYWLGPAIFARQGFSPGSQFQQIMLTKKVKNSTAATTLG